MQYLTTSDEALLNHYEFPWVWILLSTILLATNLLLFLAFNASDDVVIAQAEELRKIKAAEAHCVQVLLEKPPVCTAGKKMCFNVRR